MKKIFDEVLEDKGENEMETMLDISNRKAVEKNKNESAVKIAKQIVLLDFSLKDITAATGLSIEKIKALHRSMSS